MLKVFFFLSVVLGSPFFVVYTRKEINHSVRYLMYCGDGTDNCNTVYYDKEEVRKFDDVKEALQWINGNGCMYMEINCSPINGFKFVTFYRGLTVSLEYVAVGTRKEIVTVNVERDVPNMRWIVSPMNRTLLA